MNYLVCIDDTDMPGTKGTGWLTQELCTLISNNGRTECAPISRHQLFVHEDIPYTSHNSSMCFRLTLKKGNIQSIIKFMADFLEQKSAAGSDPGLCVAELNSSLDHNSLIKYGQDAKIKISCKKAAYALAKQTNIHLSEHGGTGQGVVGAIAGIGLRLCGNDGRYRGWYHLGQPGDIVQVDKLYQYSFIDRLVTQNGIELPCESHVHIGSAKTKTVRIGKKQVILVVKNENFKDTGIVYRTITKQEAKLF